MSWMRFLRRKRSDAELQTGDRAFLPKRQPTMRRVGMCPARPAAGVDRVGNRRRCANPLGAELSPAVDHFGHDGEVCFSYAEPHARILDHRGCGHGPVHGAATSFFTIVRSFC